MLYLGVSDSHDAQLDILEALTRKFRLDQSLSLLRVAEQCPFNYTGADFYALCSDAMLNAMSRKADDIEAKIGVLHSHALGLEANTDLLLASLNKESSQNGHPYPLTAQYYLAEMATSNDMDVLVSQKDFDRAFHDLVPSVSQSEMDHYRHIQRRFSRKPIGAEKTNPGANELVTRNNMESSKGKGRATD